MHADYIAARVKQAAPAIKVAALADAMFSIDTPDVQGVPVYPRLMNWIFNAMNCSSSVNQKCLATNPNGTACMFGANTSMFVETPLFVLNTSYFLLATSRLQVAPCSQPSASLSSAATSRTTVHWRCGACAGGSTYGAYEV